MAEALQQLVLDSLDAHGSISDTRTLVIPGSSQPATSNDAQITILGALNSLDSRQVIHHGYLFNPLRFILIHILSLR